MIYTFELELDVNCKDRYQYVRAKQGDGASRFGKITILHDGAAQDVDSGDTALFSVRKPDGTCVFDTATINSDGTVTVELTAQTLAAAGLAMADVKIQRGDALISTVSFGIHIDKNTYDEDAIESSDEYGALIDALARTEAAEDLAQDIADDVYGYKSDAETAASSASASALKAEAYAVGKKNGSDVPSTDEAYNNNAKYYSAKAAEYAAAAQSVVDSNFVLVDEDDSNKKYLVNLFVRDGYFGAGLDELVE